MNEILASVDEDNRKRSRPLPAEDLYRLKQRIRQEGITGIDFNPDLVKATRMNMAMNNDGQGGLFSENSLLNPLEWDEEANARVGLRRMGYRWIGSQDAVITNPPFGSKIPVDDRQVLMQYDLAHKWRSSPEGVWAMDADELQASQPPEILFVERCWQLLKPGTGRMAIVLPDGILGDPGLGYVRQWILRHAQVLASVDLPVEMFLPFTGTQTSVLFLRRKSYDEIDIETRGPSRPYEAFMAQAGRIGHDRRGHTIYRRDADGREIVETRHVTSTQIIDGAAQEVTEIRPIKVIDDDLPAIAQEYLAWVQRRALGAVAEIAETYR